MKIIYTDDEDPRVTRKRSFLKEYVMILSIMLVCCTGVVLMYNKLLDQKDSMALMVICISSYVFFMGALVSLGVRYIMYTGYIRPMNQIGHAVRKVASGDFTVRLATKGRNGEKDAMEVLFDDLNTMTEELATIETLKGDFIANISHEIKTPLSIIQNYAVVMKEGAVEADKQQEYLQIIIQATRKLSGLVSDILRLNKLDSQEILHPLKYSLDEQLRCCILGLDEKFDQKNIQLEAELEEVIIRTDEGLMEVVWNNILNNAIKFTPQDGTISVKLSQDGNEAIVIIKDTGCGMDEFTRSHIFDRFYQGDTSHSGEGNGLGLALVGRVIELVKGTIQVNSQSNVGSEFIIRLPLRS